MSATATILLPPGAEGVAYAIAEAEANVTRAAEVLGGATDRRNRIAARIATLEGTRSAIVSRRQRGDGEDADGATLALCAADLEGLSALLTDAERVVADARLPHQEARRALAAARHELSRMQAEAEETAIVDYLGQLEAGLLAGIARLGELRIQLGRGRPVWAPSQPLMYELRRAASAAGVL